MTTYLCGYTGTASASCPQIADVTINQYTLTCDDLATSYIVDTNRLTPPTLTVDITRLLIALSHEPISGESVQLTIGGVLQTYGVDFSLASSIITMAYIIPVGADITAQYVSI